MVLERVERWRQQLAVHALLIRSQSGKLDARQAVLDSSEGTAKARVREVRKEATKIMDEAE